LCELNLPKLRTYRSKGVTVTITESSRHKLSKNRVLSDFKNYRFTCLPDANSSFAQLEKKDVFIKRSVFKSLDYSQLKDYLDQRKVVDNIPEIYGFLEKKGELYVLSRNISSAVNLSTYLKTITPEKRKEMRSQIQEIGEKLISIGLLPWDFRPRQFMFSTVENKLYFCDNSISYSNPTYLVFRLRKMGLPVSKNLLTLSKLEKLSVFNLFRKTVRKSLNRKDGAALFTDESLTPSILLRMKNYIKRKGHALDNRSLSKVFSKTQEYYLSFSEDILKEIQRSILKECLEEFDGI